MLKFYAISCVFKQKREINQRGIKAKVLGGDGVRIYQFLDGLTAPMNANQEKGL